MSEGWRGKRHRQSSGARQRQRDMRQQSGRREDYKSSRRVAPSLALLWPSQIIQIFGEGWAAQGGGVVRPKDPTSMGHQMVGWLNRMPPPSTIPAIVHHQVHVASGFLPGDCPSASALVLVPSFLMHTCPLPLCTPPPPCASTAVVPEVGPKQRFNTHPMLRGRTVHCARCAKSWPFSSTVSLVSSEDWKDVIEWLLQWTGL